MAVRTLVFVIVLVSVVQIPEARAGDCPSFSESVKELSRLAKGKTRWTSEWNDNTWGIHCLLGQNVPSSAKRWPNKSGQPPKAASSIDDLKVIEACKPALQGATSEKMTETRQICASLVARRGVRTLAGIDLVDQSDAIFACGMPVTDLASLSGSDVARKIEAQWNAEQWSYCGAGGCSCGSAPKERPGNRKRARQRAEFFQHRNLDVISALTYAGDTQSLAFLKGKAATDSDKATREYAQRGVSYLEKVLAGSSADKP